MVKTIEWMLSHKGLAVCQILNGDINTIEIIKYSDNKNEYDEMKKFAKKGNYVLVYGKGNEKENRLGYFRN